MHMPHGIPHENGRPIPRVSSKEILQRRVCANPPGVGPQIDATRKAVYITPGRPHEVHLATELESVFAAQIRNLIEKLRVRIRPDEPGPVSSPQVGETANV